MSKKLAGTRPPKKGIFAGHLCISLQGAYNWAVIGWGWATRDVEHVAPCALDQVLSGYARRAEPSEHLTCPDPDFSLLRFLRFLSFTRLRSLSRASALFHALLAFSCIYAQTRRKRKDSSFLPLRRYAPPPWYRRLMTLYISFAQNSSRSLETSCSRSEQVLTGPDFAGP